MAHSAAAARAHSNWWLAARLTTAANLTIQAGIGSALIVRAMTSSPGDVVFVSGPWSEFGPVIAYLAGVLVLLGCVPHLVIANNVWGYRRGALHALWVVAVVQAGVQFLLLVVLRVMHPVTVALTVHAGVLILSALAGWRAHHATRRISHHGGANSTAPPATPPDTATKRAA